MIETAILICYGFLYYCDQMWCWHCWKRSKFERLVL